MSSQTHAFIEGEGDAWWARNKDRVDYSDDPVIRATETLPVPKKVLEIGCAGGGRLDVLRRLTGAECWGVEPSREAIRAGRKAFPGILLHAGTADRLPFAERFDIVIFGFCLYLVDRDHIFQAVAEADRVLSDGGHLLIYDFYPERPTKRPFHHREGLHSYKMNYSRLFIGNPAYRWVSVAKQGEEWDDRTAVHTFRKSMAEAYLA